jgi:uncharacterized protein DUF4266
MTTTGRRGLALLAALALPFLATSCATVQPWQRGRLADRCMTFDPDADLVAYQTHWQESREGSSGGYGVQAGGCACK